MSKTEEQRKEYYKEHYLKNRERIAARKKQHALDNKELYQKRSKLNYLKNKDKRKEAKKHYDKAKWAAIKQFLKNKRKEALQQAKLMELELLKDYNEKQLDLLIQAKSATLEKEIKNKFELEAKAKELKQAQLKEVKLNRIVEKEKKKAEKAAELAKLKALKQSTILAKRRALLKAAKTAQSATLA